MRRKRSDIEMAEPLKYWRAKRGYSQARLSKLSNTSALTIGHLESGKRKARGRTVEKILGALNLTEEEFFGMREGGVPGPAVVSAPKPTEAPKAAPVVRDIGGVRLSNLDLELLNRMLNLDFEAKLETLRFLQNLG